MLDIVDYIEAKGIQVVRDDGDELACYCPFHNNLDTPAFYINKITGLWICFNPSCAKRGSVRDLMIFYGDQGTFVREHTVDDILALLAEDEVKPEENDWESTLSDIKLSIPEDISKAQYLIDRGINEDTIKYFEIGYSEKKRRIVIPVRNDHFHTVGFIGRSVIKDVDPKYLYSKGMPRKNILFNLNNAKAFPSAIVVEGSIDVMKVHQAGYKNVVSTLGATVTEGHIHLLKKYFDSLTIFSDNDHAGYAMRDIIIANCYDMELKIVRFQDPDANDPGDMSEEEIKSHIENATDYFTWSFENVF